LLAGEEVKVRGFGLSKTGDDDPRHRTPLQQIGPEAVGFPSTTPGFGDYWPTFMKRTLTMFGLMLAGESIYTLPYAVRRDFANVMVDVMEISQTELGWVSSVFGVFALICYFPGGWLADRYSARTLLTFSLVATAGGGALLATLPGFWGMMAIYALWGVTSILTFWAALIKATRSWGGAEEQGLAFGLLDGGRGVVDAVLAFLAVTCFAVFGGGAGGLRSVILFYGGTALAAGALVYATVGDTGEAESPDDQGDFVARVGAVLTMPFTWLQAAIIVAAYSAYWGTFDLAAYAADGYGLDDTEAASVSAAVRWLRPIAALGAGVVADRLGASRTVALCFLGLVAAFTSFAMVPGAASPLSVLWVHAAAVGAGAFALRGIYYATMEESDVPMHLTGTTVGVVSVLGFTPDIFIPPTLGALVDAHPDGSGHRWFFAGLAVVCSAGLAASLIAFRRYGTSRSGDRGPGRRGHRIAESGGRQH
jgi:nitrate/nitrite transporter NarK